MSPASMLIDSSSHPGQQHSDDVCCNICDKVTVVQVNTDVQIVLEALGLVDSKDAKKEEAAMKDVNDILKPHMGVTWVTGNPNNKT